MPFFGHSGDAWIMRVGLYTRLAAFDSATGMVNALSDCLLGKRFSWVGALPERSRPRLLIESVILIDPFWVLLSGAIPFWTVFSTEPSYFRALEYIRCHEPFEENLAMVFPHDRYISQSD
jgi:hypothetical protein